MAKLAANLTWLFTERPFLDRFACAAACGFRAVEILYPYETPAAQIAAALSANQLELVLINLPPGNLRMGERGFAARPGDENRFDEALDQALAYAAICGCTRLHAMSGRRVDGAPLAEHEAVLAANLAKAAVPCSEAGVTLLIEPLNARDNPGYILTSIAQALHILERVAQPNVSLQLDLYHTFTTEGDVEERVHALRGRFAHVQAAGCPDRHEPDTGELDAGRVFALLDADGYAGWIGLEYHPRTTTQAGLAWAEAYLRNAAEATE